MIHAWQMERVLILAKTYPNPSSKHREITCVAGVNDQGQMRRLFPLPYRYLHGEQQFKKWQWIRAKVRKAPHDHRVESHNIDVDTLEPGEVVGTAGGWQQRLKWLHPFLHRNPNELEATRQSAGITLGVVKPLRILELQITASERPDWTEAEKANLMQESLFDPEEVRDKLMLRKVPYDFHYVYECESADGTVTFKHKITDWEAGALYWNCRKSAGNGWEEPFRQRLEAEFRNSKQVYFLLGTIHRFPDQWLIVGLAYPPKPAVNTTQQLDLWT